MARWGEGDPRWIVEDRPDATNVNNWHWTEKNATPWSKDRLKQLLENLVIETADQGLCKITELKKLEGEATANNRKGKLIFLYEWDIKCVWEGTLKYDTDKYEGRIEIPNLSDENGADDLDITVTIKSTEEAAQKLKSLMIKHGAPVIRAQLAKYITELKEEYSKNLILPTLDKSGGSGPINSGGKSKEKKPVTTEVILNTETIKNMNINHGPVKIHTKSLTLKEEFKCTGCDLYNVFTRIEMLQAFSRGPCESDVKPGGQFVLYNGVVRGKYQQLDMDKKIVMEWRMNSWPDAHYSTVTMTFNQKEDCTELELRQTGVPESQLEQTENGWKRHYFEAIKQTFGYGARLF